MGSKKNNHLQPAHYLKGFETDTVDGNPKVWVYKKGLPFDESQNQKRQNPQAKVPESTAWKKGFYSFLKDDGKRDYNTYENRLLHEFEEPAQPVIEKIRYFKEIGEKEKIILFRYIASMVTRGEWWKHISDKVFSDAIEERYKGNDIETLELKSQIIDEIEKYKKKEDLKVKMIETANLLSSWFQQMRLRFLIAPENVFFLTSDRPFYYTNLEEPNSYATFPISSKITILLTRQIFMNEERWKRKSEHYWEVDYETVKHCRGLICSRAIKEVYYSQKAEWLVKFINNIDNN